ncbi:hypothetical protein GIB67_007842 [Kingdonia uniflora]|uniref:Uncharacterized protein n=1 Tax=Kingdonia uniflora TaxID=39325 RepID=A0A7J7N1X9_9MAGN|nr:hypothetical protein GIB67_007842 [Kingdonia uniflora]
MTSNLDIIEYKFHTINKKPDKLESGHIVNKKIDKLESSQSNSELCIMLLLIFCNTKICT